jgi:hypothetical protein
MLSARSAKNKATSRFFKIAARDENNGSDGQELDERGIYS